jgi:hypothetical protein
MNFTQILNYEIIINENMNVCEKIFILFDLILNSNNIHSNNKNIRYIFFVKGFMDNIFDIDNLNKTLESYNITIIDSNNVSLKVINSLYGNNSSKYVDITEKLTAHFFENNSLKILKNSDLNAYFEDPCINYNKNIEIALSCNNNIINIFEKENVTLNNDIVLNECFIQVDTWNKLFDINNIEYTYFILNNFKFNKTICDIAHKFMSINNINYSKLNVIHICLENVLIDAFADINNVNTNMYAMQITKKYIEIIKNDLDKTTPVFVIGNYINNDIINYLDCNGFNYIIRKHQSDVIDYEYAIDLEIALKCNNIFIGCEESSFSQFIHKKAISIPKNILIRYKNINSTEIRINKIYK